MRRWRRRRRLGRLLAESMRLRARAMELFEELEDEKGRSPADLRRIAEIIGRRPYAWEQWY